MKDENCLQFRSNPCAMSDLIRVLVSTQIVIHHCSWLYQGWVLLRKASATGCESCASAAAGACGQGGARLSSRPIAGGRAPPGAAAGAGWCGAAHRSAADGGGAGGAVAPDRAALEE